MTLPKRIYYSSCEVDYLKFIQQKLLPRNHWSAIKDIINLILLDSRTTPLSDAMLTIFRNLEQHSFPVDRWIFDEAMKAGAKDIMNTLLQHRYTLPLTSSEFAPSPEEDSSLHLAIRNDYLVAVNILASSKACVLHENKHGETPALLATKLEKWEFLRYILSNHPIENSDEQEDAYGYVKAAQQLGAEIASPKDAETYLLQIVANTLQTKVANDRDGFFSQAAESTAQVTQPMNRL